VLALGLRGVVVAPDVCQLRALVGTYIGAHLDGALGAHGTWRDNIEDEGLAASAEAYVQEVTAGLTAGGNVPYGGAIEIEAFVRLECLGDFTVRVWAAPGDPLCAAAAGHNEFLHIATYGVGDEVIDLSLRKPLCKSSIERGAILRAPCQLIARPHLTALAMAWAQRPAATENGWPEPVSGQNVEL
jgi:hypothetical protein